MIFAGAILLLYVLVILLVAVIAFQGTAWYRRHRVKQRRQGPPTGFERTPEIYIDPTTGIRQRVWYNPTTGVRFYETLEDDEK
jgi:hypothetical protein